MDPSNSAARPPSPSRDHEPGSASSPTPTIRSKHPTPNRPGVQGFSIPEGEGGEERANVDSGMRVISGGAEQQQALGKGRPAKIDTDRRSPTEERVPPSFVQNRPDLSPARASFRSSLDTDEEYEQRRHRPLTAYPGVNMSEQTPRAGSSMRGPPQTATLGSSYGSPDIRHALSGSAGSTGPRPTRIMRNYTAAAYPASNPGNTSFNASNFGSVSRSASRARPPMAREHSVGPEGVPGRAKAENGDDDEEEVVDRGADLIKRRQQERREARRVKKLKEERDRRFANGETPDTSAPPTAGLASESFDDQVRTARSVSRNRERTNQGRRLPSSGYFDQMAALDRSRDGTTSPYDELRAPSILSSTDDDEDLPFDRHSILDEPIPEDRQLETEEEGEMEDGDEDSGDAAVDTEEGVTMRDRQDAINIEHPFGLPIWKPALYRKSRSVTRNAESALHLIPSAAAERHLLPGNIFWIIIFGWWLGLTCLLAALVVGAAEVFGGGRGGYAKTLRGLSWYIAWPFGKYVEGEGAPDHESTPDEESPDHPGGAYGALSQNGSPLNQKLNRHREASDGAASNRTVRPDERRPSASLLPSASSPVTPTNDSATTLRQPREPTVSFAPGTIGSATGSPFNASESQSLLGREGFRRPRNKRAKFLGRLIYWPAFFFLVAPFMLFVCTICWGLVITIPMAKLTWALLKLLYFRPLEINFRSAPRVPVPVSPESSPGPVDENADLSGSSTAVAENSSPSGFTMKRARLQAGQLAPTSGPDSTVLLCTYRAVGLQYYKYTVGGVNIIFIDLLPLAFFAIFDGLVLLPIVERRHEAGQHVSAFLAAISAPIFVFILGLASVIPLSYFIGMAVASISAQSSIGVGATINATFGSIIEVILYAIALMQGKGKLVEGSIVGSILAGVLLMPGASMCSGAVRRKEQKFNAKSAGVTSTMLIMAIIGTLTPTMFYQTYGSFELHCEGCPEDPPNALTEQAHRDMGWKCNHCYYEHPDPMYDSFYQEKVKILMYFCAGILCLSYFIGCLFSLKTHASQIWTDPKPLMKPEEFAHLHPAIKQSLRQRMTPEAFLHQVLPLHRERDGAATPRLDGTLSPRATLRARPETIFERRAASGGGSNLPAGYTPLIEAITQKMKQDHLTPIRLPSSLTAPATAIPEQDIPTMPLVHKGSVIGSQAGAMDKVHDDGEAHEGGGHEGPSWTREVSTVVLLGCTVLYAGIAEVLVDVVDVVLAGSGIDEKFLGLTLFALVPNTTEFMNAMSFALNGNIALSMEIGSAYALQVCLVQIPFLVAFSAFYDPSRMGEEVDTFTLIFPRWDVIAIILSIFLLTYTYIEARANYHRGSILVLSYLVLMMGFYFAPPRSQGEIDTSILVPTEHISTVVSGMSMGIKTAFTKLWA